MEININQNMGISAQWKLAVCTPTETGDIIEFPYGENYRNNAILNYFLSGMILHLWHGGSPRALLPSHFTDGFIQLGTGIKPISYTDDRLDKFIIETNYVRPRTTPSNIKDTIIFESGMAIYEKTYDFPVMGGKAYYTEAGFRQHEAGALWNRNPYFRNPIYTRFLFTQESPITGYISGSLNNGNFNIFDHRIDHKSGVFATIMTGNDLWRTYQYEINPKTIIRERITGFISGYMSYLGAFTSFTGNNKSSGFFLSGQKLDFPPYRIFAEDPIIGYISGNMTELSGFIPYTGDGLDSSGYYLTGTQYEFQEPFSEFSGLSGFENGYNYYGFNFTYGSGFISDIPNETYGHGKATGIIGSRNILSFSGTFNGFEDFSGFDKKVGYGFDKFFTTGSGFASGFVPDLNNSLLYGSFRFGTGMMTGIIGHRNIFRENIYSGLSGIRSHEYGWYFTKSGMFGESGMKIVSGSYSGYYPNQTGFSGIIYKQNDLIVGFISGYQDENGFFNPFYNTEKASGYILNAQKYYFPTGQYFSGFNSGDVNFSGKQFNFTGFSFPLGSGFSGIEFSNSGTGIMSGYIGDITNSYISNTGILTGIVGYKKYISGVTLELGQYLKVYYKIHFRIPQLLEATHVTGENIVYGDFNGSGQLKFVGRMISIFGLHENTDSDSYQNGYTSWVPNSGVSEGVWWPAADGGGRNSFDGRPDMTLMPLMLNSGEALSIKPNFPPINSRPILITLTGEHESCSPTYGCLQTVPNIYYPMARYGTLWQSYTGGYSISVTTIFRGEWPNQDVEIGGIWFSYGRSFFNGPIGDRDRITVAKGESGQAGWLYKFNTPQKKWEDQAIFYTVTLGVERDQFFEDPYYGRYPQ